MSAGIRVQGDALHALVTDKVTQFMMNKGHANAAAEKKESQRLNELAHSSLLIIQSDEKLLDVIILKQEKIQQVQVIVGKTLVEVGWMTGADRNSASGETEKVSKAQLRVWIHEHMHSGDKGMTYTAEQILPLLDSACQVFEHESTLIELKAPIKICGDIHGQFVDLKRLFRANGKPPLVTMLFLGDYVDRGPHSVEVIVLLLCFKVKHPGTMFLLRGNHESPNINRVYGFYDELKKRNLLELWPEFNRVFSWMPLAARINHKILCMHGGISQFIKRLSDIRLIDKPLMYPPTDKIAMDLLWADPDKNHYGYTKSDRGVSYHFGVDVLEEFCMQMGIDVVVRGHQCVMSGFERIGCNGRTRLVTVFSAPKYCGEMDNNAAVMQVREDLSIKFNVLEVNDDQLYNAKRDLERLDVPKIDKYPIFDKSDINRDLQSALTKGAGKVLHGIKGKATTIINKLPGKKTKLNSDSSKTESPQNEVSSGDETNIATTKPQKQETHSQTEDTPEIQAEESKSHKEDTKIERENTQIKTEDTQIETADTPTKRVDTQTKIEDTQTKIEDTQIKRDDTQTKRDESKSRREKSKSRKDKPKSQKKKTKSHKKKTKSRKEKTKSRKDDNNKNTSKKDKNPKTDGNQQPPQ